MGLVPIKETQRNPSSLQPREDTAKGQPPMNQEEGPHQTLNCWCLDLGRWASRTMRNKSLLFISHQVQGIALQQPAQTKGLGKQDQNDNEDSDPKSTHNTPLLPLQPQGLTTEAGPSEAAGFQGPSASYMEPQVQY